MKKPEIMKKISSKLYKPVQPNDPMHYRLTSGWNNHQGHQAANAINGVQARLLAGTAGATVFETYATPIFLEIKFVLL